MNKLLLLNILVSFIRRRYWEEKISVETLLKQVRDVHPSVVNNDVVDAINSIVNSGFVPEISKFDSENKVLYLNCG